MVTLLKLWVYFSYIKWLLFPPYEECHTVRTPHLIDTSPNAILVIPSDSHITVGRFDCSYVRTTSALITWICTTYPGVLLSLYAIYPVILWHPSIFVVPYSVTIATLPQLQHLIQNQQQIYYSHRKKCFRFPLVFPFRLFCWGVAKLLNFVNRNKCNIINAFIHFSQDIEDTDHKSLTCLKENQKIINMVTYTWRVC